MNGQVMHETKTHGRLTFPYTVYKSVIPQYFSSFPLHWHDEAEIIYIDKGSVDITVQSARFTANAGDTVIVMPQTVHSIDRHGSSETEYFNIMFNFSLLDYSANGDCYEKYFKPLYNHTRISPVRVSPGTELHDLLAPHLLYLIDNRRVCADDELMIKSKLFAVMDGINKFAVAASTRDMSLKNNYDKLKNLLVYMRTNYGDEISVEKAAELCSYSPSHFMKLFKELTGKSFTRYLIDYRLETAAKRLKDTNANVTDIASGAGFNSMSYFSRAFGAVYGCSPSEYRDRMGS